MELISCENTTCFGHICQSQSLGHPGKTKVKRFIVELKCKQSSSFNIYWKTVSIEMVQENNNFFKKYKNIKIGKYIIFSHPNK